MLQIQEVSILSANPALNRWAQFQVSAVQMKGSPNLFTGSLHIGQNHWLQILKDPDSSSVSPVTGIVTLGESLKLATHNLHDTDNSIHHPSLVKEFT